MGKVALLLVTVSMISLSVMHMNRNRRAFETEAETANYKDKVLAREIATSSLNVIVGRISRDFAGKRGTWTNVPYGDGTYTITVSGPPEGPALVTVTGEVNGQEHTVTAEVVKDGSITLDAVTLDGPVKKFEMKNAGADISGYDEKVNGDEGAGPHVHGIRAIDATGFTAVTETMIDKLLGPQIIGVDGSGDVVSGAGEIGLEVLVNAVLAYGGPGRLEFSKLKLSNSEQLGTAEDPVVAIVDGKADFKDTSSGYGILYVNGDLKMSKSARWEGLVLVNGEKPKVDLKDNVTIMGALVVRTIAHASKGKGADPGLPGGHFDIDVFDEPNSTSEIYHQHKYDDSFDVTGVDLLSAGCKNGGGLCWSTVMAGKTAAWIEIMNPTSSYGNYVFSASAGNGVPAVHLSGTSEAGLVPTRFNAAGATQMTVDFYALCALTPTSPGTVQDDASSRAGSFSIKIFDDVAGAKGTLAYELAVYHHTSDSYQCLPGSSDDLPTEQAVAMGEAFDFKVAGDARIQYSAQALKRLTDLVEIIAPGSGNVKLKDARSVNTLDEERHKNKGRDSDESKKRDIPEGG